MMAKLSQHLTKLVIGLVVLAVVVGAGLYYLGHRGTTKKVTARFASAVGIYPGTPVDILGVPVGEVTKVTPDGGYVSIEMDYDSKYSVPPNAISVVVANSLVSDRYIQLAPAYSGTGPTLASGALIPESRTASPAELDGIYAAVNKLSVALGPAGANKTGSLNALLAVSAANLSGNGAALGNSITQLSKSASTLANGKDDLFGTVKNLQAFTQALSDSDVQVRHFEEQLAQVASDLASERGDLGTALTSLSGALNSVAQFVSENAGKLHTDISGLKLITNVLIKQKASLNETLAISPVALANMVHAYNPALGAIGTRSNMGALTDPGQLCQVLSLTGILGASSMPLTDPIAKLAHGLLGPVLDTVASACQQVIAKIPSSSQLQLPAGVSTRTLTDALNKLLALGGTN